jgi:hypothetical protein
MIERSGDAVCGLHRPQTDKECGFLGSASKTRSMVSFGLASKPVAMVLVVWLASKPLTQVFRFRP